MPARIRQRGRFRPSSIAPKLQRVGTRYDPRDPETLTDTAAIGENNGQEHCVTEQRPDPKRNEDDWLATYWPELALLPDVAVRKSVFSEMQRRYFTRNPWFYLYAAAITVGVFLGGMFGVRWLVGLLGWLGLPGWVAVVAIGVGAVIVYYVGICVIWAGVLRRALRRRLVSMGIPVCVGCGYDCHGLAQARCPECGQSFDEALLRPTPPADG